MLEQRVSLGLTRSESVPNLADPSVVVPVLAVGAGQPSRVARTRMSAVAHALEMLSAREDVDYLEVWRIDRKGRKVGTWL
jgi:hypothetical protein